MRAGVRHVVMCAFVLVMIYPLIWMVAGSFKPSNLVLSEPGLIPSEVTFQNYRDGWNALDEPFSLFFLNSLLVSVGRLWRAWCRSWLSQPPVPSIPRHICHVFFQPKQDIQADQGPWRCGLEAGPAVGLR